MAPQRHPQTLWTWFRTVAFFDVSFFPLPSQKRDRAEAILGAVTSSTDLGARTTSVLKDLKHRNACVGLAGNNLELAGNGKP